MGWNDRVRRVEPVQEIPRPAVLGGTYCARSGISPTGIPTARRRRTRWPSCPACTGCGLRASGSMKKRRRLRSYLRRRVREILAKYADVAVLEKFMTKPGQRLRGSVPVRAGSADSVNQQRRGTRAARDSGAQEDTRIHQVKEHDAVAREPVLVRHDMAAARHRPPRRDRKIRLDGANTYGWRSAIFLRNSTSSSRCLRNSSSSSRCLRINLSNCSFLMSTFCLSLRYSVLAFLYSFL